MKEVVQSHLVWINDQVGYQRRQYITLVPESQDDTDRLKSAARHFGTQVTERDIAGQHITLDLSIKGAATLKDLELDTSQEQTERENRRRVKDKFLDRISGE